MTNGTQEDAFQYALSPANDTAAMSDEEDAGSWRCPRRCSCVVLPGGTSYNCSLPSGPLSFDEYGDGITFKCHGGALVCAQVPSRGAAGLGALGAVLRSVTLRECAPAPEPLLCALQRRGARAALRLSLVAPRAPLAPAHVRGLDTLTMLRITDLDGQETEFPLAALRELPALRQLTVDNARLVLRGPLPPLPLETLELADDALEQLPEAAFRNLTHLKRLALWKNNLSELAEDTFEGLGALHDLSLSHNRLRALPPRLLARTPLLARLDLYGNPLTALPAELFAGLHHLQQIRLVDNVGNLTLGPGVFSNLSALEELDLSGSVMGALPADALRGCAALRRLLLRRCGLRALPATSLHGLGALRELDLSRNALSHLPLGLFTDLHNLTKLNLDHNQITMLPSTVFVGLSRLESMSLQHNGLAHIAEGAFVGVRSLRALVLSHNELALGAPAPADGERYELLGTQSPFSGLLLLEQLELAHNRVRELLDDWRTVLVSLRTLNLSWNNITDLNYMNMNFLSADVTVDLRHNNISTVLLSGPSGGSAHLLLDDNPFRCDCHAAALQAALAEGVARDGPRLSAPSARCAAPPSLAGRQLAAVPRDALLCALRGEPCPAGCGCLLRPDRLDLDCAALPSDLSPLRAHGLLVSELRLRSVPAVVPALPDVTRISLSGLNLTELPPLPANVELDLSDNRLTRVPAALLLNNTLRLRGNRLACDCGHAADVAALQRAGRVVRDYAELRCAAGAGGAALRLVDPSALCLERDRVILGASLGAAAALLLVVMLLLRLYGFRLLLLILEWGVCSPEEDDDDEKTYDAFISFAHPDVSFAEELVQRLEAPPRPLRACVHYRDWPVGDWIPAQIARSVSCSRRTVILLSRDFLVSVWGLLEFREAHLRALREGRARVVVVLLDDVMSDPRMTDELRAYLTTTTYLRRDDARFWTKVERALRPSRSVAARLRRAARRWAASVTPTPGPPAAVPAAVPADKLLRSALDGKLTHDGQLVNAAFTAPSL
ncbi:protein toll-like [Battus philenor]|uniref:protein toll-like n=1 Tax=Battus philenor TaxID=42288 RepID=UPI0035CECB5A